MIPVSEATWQTPRWQRELACAVSDPAELLRLLDLDQGLLAGARRAASHFRLKVPRPFIARMRRGDPSDPLLRQVLPLDAENDQVPGFVPDPLRESLEDKGDGVLQKYRHRALVITTGACAVHCRYCFRRHFPYGDQQAESHGWDRVLDRFRLDPELTEAILSGGDPLALSDKRLSKLAAGLSDIPHLQRLRIHTRVPVMLPSRVDDALLDWIQRCRLQVVVVLHVNHPSEVDADVGNALVALRNAGVTLLNQSVLLKGVNDDVGTLVALSERLFEIGVLPYYLHLMDPVTGAAHHDVSSTRALDLFDGLRSELPGYLVPRLVRETPGELSKTIMVRRTV